MVYAMLQVFVAFGSEEEFQGFYHIWAWHPSLSCDQLELEQSKGKFIL